MEQSKDVEEAIQQMQRILDKYITKLELVMCLPLIMQNENLKSILGCHVFSVLYEICNYYSRNEKHFVYIEEFGAYEENLKTLKMDIGLSYLLEVLYSNHNVRILVKEYLESTDLSSIKIITFLHRFKKFMEEQMKITPEQENQHNMNLRHATINLRDMKEEFISLREMLMKQRMQHEQVIKKLSTEIAECQLIIEKMQKRHEKELARIMDASETEMGTINKKFELQEKSIEMYSTSWGDKYKILLQKNLHKEAQLHRIRLDTEREYLYAVNEYDNEIELYHQLREDLNIELNSLTKEHEKLQMDFSIQEKQFFELKKEKEMALMRAFAEQLENFEKNRAARIIQRTWKAFLQRVALKKKKKTRRK